VFASESGTTKKLTTEVPKHTTYSCIEVTGSCTRYHRLGPSGRKRLERRRHQSDWETTSAIVQQVGHTFSYIERKDSNSI
jgi:hypothetical protein